MNKSLKYLTVDNLLTNNTDREKTLYIYNYASKLLNYKKTCKILKNAKSCII